MCRSWLWLSRRRYDGSWKLTGIVLPVSSPEQARAGWITGQWAGTGYMRS
jgi:hypothetical protein